MKALLHLTLISEASRGFPSSTEDRTCCSAVLPSVDAAAPMVSFCLFQIAKLQRKTVILKYLFLLSAIFTWHFQMIGVLFQIVLFHPFQNDAQNFYPMRILYFEAPFSSRVIYTKVFLFILEIINDFLVLTTSLSY